MADAKALFNRHWTSLEARISVVDTAAGIHAKALVFAACILAEAIRTEQEALDFVAPKESPKI